MPSSGLRADLALSTMHSAAGRSTSAFRYWYQHAHVGFFVTHWSSCLATLALVAHALLALPPLPPPQKRER